jgi:ERCC4-related helicase
MSPEQLEIYNSMKDNFIAELGGEVTVAEFSMTKTMRLRQILAGFIQPEEKAPPVWMESVPKLETLSDLLEQLKGNKVIVWTEFSATYKAISTVCDAVGVSYRLLTGDQTTKQKEENIEAFCRGPIEVLIANPAAGGAGINIQEAPYSIYFDKGYSAVNFEQSRGRNHRAGSGMHSKITHYHLVTPNSLDEIISGALLKKLDLQAEVLKWALDIFKSNSYKSNKKETSKCQSL